MKFILPRKRLLILALVPVVLLAIGTIGYELIEEKFSLFDAFYMTVITLTTVGYGEIPHELSTPGRVFTIFLLLGGVFTLFFTSTEVLKSLLTNELQVYFGERRREMALQQIKGHMIVCGYGRIGRIVSQEFSIHKIPFVVIDRSEANLAGFNIPGGIPLVGDATNDEVLIKAGIERAKSLLAVIPSDADNLYISMSARLLNEKIFIVARAEQESSEIKMRRAGVNRVVSPYTIGGFRMAQAIIRPAVVDFIDLATKTRHLALQIEENHIQPGSPLEGKAIEQVKSYQEIGVIVVGLRNHGAEMIFNPPGNHVLKAHDTIVSLGSREQLDRLEVACKSGKITN